MLAFETSRDNQNKQLTVFFHLIVSCVLIPYQICQEIAHSIAETRSYRLIPEVMSWMAFEDDFVLKEAGTTEKLPDSEEYLSKLGKSLVNLIV